MDRRRVLIVGGGIAGLALAPVLARTGVARRRTQGSFDEDGFDYITDPSNWPDYGTDLHSGHRAE